MIKAQGHPGRSVEQEARQTGVSDIYSFAAWKRIHREAPKMLGTALDRKDVTYLLHQQEVTYVGCGNMYEAVMKPTPTNAIVAAFASRRSVFIDINEEAVAESAMAFPASEYPNISFRVADARSLPLETNSCDFAISMNTMTYLGVGMPRGLAELNRVARKGVIVNFPHTSNQFAGTVVAEERFGNVSSLGYLHAASVTEEGVDNLFGELGFSASEVKKEVTFDCKGRGMVFVMAIRKDPKG